MAKQDTSLDALLARGFDPGAPAVEAVAKLSEIRETEGVSDALIAHALGRIQAPESAQLLAEMERAASGPLRREIRRALFRLRQHGIATPETESALAVALSSAPSGLSGLLSTSDADGARIVWLMKARSPGGFRRLWGLVSNRSGLLGATLEAVTRKELRADRSEVERRAGTRLIEADWRVADFLMTEAYAQTPPERRGRVGNYLTLRSELVDGPPPTAIAHPIYREMAGALAAEPAAELMQQPEVGAYQLAPEQIKPYVEEVADLQQSVLVLSRMQQEERVRTIIEHAIEILLKDATAERLRRHLEDTAYLLAHSGKPAEARWAAAAAARLRDGAEIKRSPFFEAFMRAQLGAVIAEQQEEKRDEPRLIMTPAEMMRARQTAQARMRGR